MELGPASNMAAEEEDEVGREVGFGSSCFFFDHSMKYPSGEFDETKVIF